MNRKSTSLAIILCIYIAASALGIVIYIFLDMDYRLKLLFADISATIFVFIFSLLFKNSSVYDPYWSVAPIVIILSLMFGIKLNCYLIMLSVVIFIWGIRLTANWVYTFNNFTYQDWRYIMLREKSGIMYPVINFLGIHLFPTIVVYLCILPAVSIFIHIVQGSIFSFLSLLICLGATALQTVSDIQMHTFRAKKERRLIDCGLWKYSRHPNYLGEILMWWGVALSSFLAKGIYDFKSVLLCFTGAIINTLMFLFISIPMADKRQSEKPGWDEYKARTRMLIPIKKVL